MNKTVFVLALVALITITAAKPRVDVAANPSPDPVNVVNEPPGQVQVVDGEGQVNFVDGQQGPQPRGQEN